MRINQGTLIFIIIILFFGVYCSSIIGISWDEPSNNEYNLHKINFLKSYWSDPKYRDFSLDTAITGYFWKLHQHYHEAHNPGFYATILTFVSNLFPEFYVYYARHLINFVLSAATLLGVYLVVRDNFNKRLGLLTVLFCLLNPFFFGFMAITVRDMPMCFAYVWTIYFFSKYIQNFFGERLKYSIFIGLAIGFGMGTRVGYFINLFPIFLIFIYFIFLNKEKIKFLVELKKIPLDLLIIVILGFTILFSLWMAAYNAPFETFLLTIENTLGLSGPKSQNLFLGPVTDIINGSIYDTTNIPRKYLLIFFLTRFPIFLIALTLFSFLIIIIKNYYFTNKYLDFNNKIIAAFFIPSLLISIIIFYQVKLYDGIRLLIFLIPFFSFFAAIGFNFLLDNFRKNHFNKILLFSVLLTFFAFAERFIRLTPYQYDFTNYSHFLFKDSRNSYQHDFWGTSYRELINKIKKDKEYSNKKFTVAVCGGNLWQVIFEFSKNKQFRENVRFYRWMSADKADYIIMTNRLGQSDPKFKYVGCFYRYEGKDIYSVKRMGVTYSVFRKLNKHE